MSVVRPLGSYMGDRTSVLLQACGSSSDFLVGMEAVIEPENNRKKSIREQAAKSKTGIWGPTHSFDTDEETNGSHADHQKKESNSSDTTKEETRSTEEESLSPPRKQESSFRSSSPLLNRIYESAVSVMAPTSLSLKSCLARNEGNTASEHNRVALSYPSEMLAALDPCSPCSHPDIHTPPRSLNPAEDGSPGALCNLKNNTSTAEATEIMRDLSLTESQATPASRRRQRHMERLRVQARLEMANAPAPVKNLEVQPQLAERSISELTMRSSYAEATAKLAEQRRMAYYAVGKHHGRSGGNRRCYFSGKLILGGAPFYAGSVQQGLRTLVVFCLPSALGLPLSEGQALDLKRQTSLQSIASVTTKESSMGFAAKPRSLVRRARSVAGSRLSSLDDMSLSYEEEQDDIRSVDREYLLRVLPCPSQDLLDNMADRYPEQFETLPVQVRSPHCWRLFVKFCFFSGLPIAEGEMHYKVQDQVAEPYGEEIILSHEVMEAVNGTSAEILRLPNQKTFRYLQKHYTQQCGKLNGEVFKRESWELILPEV